MLTFSAMQVIDLYKQCIDKLSLVNKPFDKLLNIALKTLPKYASKTHVKGSRTHFLLMGDTNIAKEVFLVENRGLFLVFLNT